MLCVGENIQFFCVDHNSVARSNVLGHHNQLCFIAAVVTGVGGVVFFVVKTIIIVVGVVIIIFLCIAGIIVILVMYVRFEHEDTSFCTSILIDDHNQFRQEFGQRNFLRKSLSRDQELDHTRTQ